METELMFACKFRHHHSYDDAAAAMVVIIHFAGEVWAIAAFRGMEVQSSVEQMGGIKSSECLT